MTADPWSVRRWCSSAFDGYRDLLDVFGQFRDWPNLRDLERLWFEQYGAVTTEGTRLRLVAQTTKSRRAKPKSRDALYDVSVNQGAIPTRVANWHDFFNVMMFVAFARTKQQLHARQRRIVEERIPLTVARLPGCRTEEQDCLTILDEGGVVLVTEHEALAQLEDLLAAGTPRALRDLVRDGRVRPWLIGHAHLEHLTKRPDSPAAPLPSAKAIALDLGVGASRSDVDAALATRLLDPTFCATRDRRRPVALDDLFLDLSAGH